MTLKADADANARRPRLGESLAQFDDRFSRKPRNRGCAGRRRVENPLAKRLPADGALADELPILLAFEQHDMQQAEGERQGPYNEFSLDQSSCRL